MNSKFTKIMLGLVLVALLGGQVFAYKYVMNANATYSYVVPTTQVMGLDGGDWDDGYFDYALPGDFEFYYYGRKVTHLRISTNGFILFGFGSATGDGVLYENTALPDATDPDQMAAVQWDDWDLTNHGAMYYDLLGTAPNRTFVIEWRGIPSHLVGTEYYTFEAILYEGSNNILYQYNEVLQSSSHDFGNKATVGVEHPTGLQGEQYSYNTPDLVNGQAILFTPFVHVYDTTDFTGDGIPDPTIYRPSNTGWYVRSDGAWITSGNIGDVPVPGDYDGDGRAYRATYNPATSTWSTEIGDIVYGTEGDIPVPADYDGDGTTDIAVFRPSNGTWYVYGFRALTYGTAGDIPMPVDLDGDGDAEFVVWRPSNATFYAYRLGAYTYGTAGDIPVRGDFDGGGWVDVALWRPTTGIWFVYSVETMTKSATTHGTYGDIPVPADINGDGMTDKVVWRPSNGIWYFKGFFAATYGTLGDIPMLR